LQALNPAIDVKDKGIDEMPGKRTTGSNNSETDKSIGAATALPGREI
jgi:hypothetical protein